MIASHTVDLVVRLLPMVITMGTIFLILFLLRTKATPMRSLEEFEQKFQSGKPVVVEFFSNG